MAIWRGSKRIIGKSACLQLSKLCICESIQYAIKYCLVNGQLNCLLDCLLYCLLDCLVTCLHKQFSHIIVFQRFMRLRMSVAISAQLRLTPAMYCATCNRTWVPGPYGPWPLGFQLMFVCKKHDIFSNHRFCVNLKIVL